MRHFDIDFLFLFSYFWSDFLKMVFSIHSESTLGLVLLFSQWKFFELYVRTCPAMFFIFVLIQVWLKWDLIIHAHVSYKLSHCPTIDKQQPSNSLVQQTQKNSQRFIRMLQRFMMVLGHRELKKSFVYSVWDVRNCRFSYIKLSLNFRFIVLE